MPSSVRAEEHGGAANLFDRGKFTAGLAFKHHLLDHLFAPHAVFCHRVRNLCLDQRGQHVTGADGVGSNGLFGGFQRGGLGQAVYPCAEAIFTTLPPVNLSLFPPLSRILSPFSSSSISLPLPPRACGVLMDLREYLCTSANW